MDMTVTGIETAPQFCFWSLALRVRFSCCSFLLIACCYVVKPEYP